MSYIMSKLFDKMVLPVCNQVYSIVWEAVVLLSLLVDGILCSCYQMVYYLFLYIWQIWLYVNSVQFHVCMFCCNVDMSNVRLAGNFDILTGYDGEVWVLGRFFFDLSYSLGPQCLSNWKDHRKLGLVFTCVSW